MPRRITEKPPCTTGDVSKAAPVATPLDEQSKLPVDLLGLIERIPDLVLLHHEGEILWVNRALLTGLGYDAVAELVGHRLHEIIAQDDHPFLEERLRRDPTAPRPLDELDELHVCRRDGATLIMEVSQAQLVPFAGRMVRLVVARDITERRRMQEQLLIADRMATLGMLAAGVAHEISNPLAYAQAHIDRAVRELAGLDGAVAAETVARVRSALATAREGTSRVQGIVRDLKTFSRSPSSDDRCAVDVREVMESTLALAGPEIARRARVLPTWGHARLVAVEGGRLAQVFLNLLDNAADAVTDASGRPGSPPFGEIRIRTADDPATGRVLVEVSDNGPGVPEALRARVFNPFFTTKPVGRGTGLGLAICHRIVVGLGGSITLHSAPGAGAVFRVLLPMADDTLALPAVVPSPPSGRAGRPRVLVIDDEPAILRGLAGVLEEHNDVVCIASGHAALDLLLDDDRFDVVLCDLTMGGLTGEDLYHALADARPGTEERVLFMTGGAHTPAAERFLAGLPGRCVEKPFDLADLQRLLAERIAVVRRSRVNGASHRAG